MDGTGPEKKGSDDAEDARLAFEAFMLSGKKPAPAERVDESSSQAASQSGSSRGKKKKKKKKRPSSGSDAGTPHKSSPAPGTRGGGSAATEVSLTPRQSPAATKGAVKVDKKRYYQLLRSFNDKVQGTWFDIDDQLLAVMENIASIRSRLPLEWKVLHSPSLKINYGTVRDSWDDIYHDGDSDDMDGGQDDLDEDEDIWKIYGLSDRPPGGTYAYHLHEDDVRLALTDDLEQHERMLAGAGSLLSDLVECQEALGRVVDSLWKFHLDCHNSEVEGWGDEDAWLKEGEVDMERMVEDVTEAYQMLSSELYRKQLLVPLVLESTEDEILGIERPDGSGGVTGRESTGGGDGRGVTEGLEIARRCSDSWPRNSKESSVNLDLISRLVKLGGGTAG